MENIDNKIQDTVQRLIDRMFERINEPDVKTEKLSEIIKMASSASLGIYEGLTKAKGLGKKIPYERIDNSIKNYLNFLRVIVEANHKAQSILNPNIKIKDIEEQYKELINSHNIDVLRKKYRKSINWEKYPKS